MFTGRAKLLFLPLLQQRDDFLVAALFGQRQGIFAVLVFGFDIGAAAQKKLNHLFVAFARRRHQRRRLEPIGLVDLRLVFEQQLHQVEAVVGGRRDETGGGKTGHHFNAGIGVGTRR